MTLASLVPCRQSNNMFPWVESRNCAIPGGPVVKNLPANAGDMGLIPGAGRSHSHWATREVPNNCRSPQLQKSPTTAEVLTPRATPRSKRSRRNEKAEHHRNEKAEHHTQREPSLAVAGESPSAVRQTQHSQNQRKNGLWGSLQQAPPDQLRWPAACGWGWTWLASPMSAWHFTKHGVAA